MEPIAESAEDFGVRTPLQRLLAPGVPGRLWPRWLFLRGLGICFGSAFFSLAHEIHGMIGPRGILPAGEYLRAIAPDANPIVRLWEAPTILWASSSDGMLWALVAIGLAASALLILNVAPRSAIAVCMVAFLSFVAATDVFSSYQSDGMLLEAAFLSLFFAPPGLRPGLGEGAPPSRASLFLLQWEWFRIHFSSGVVKILSGDPQWQSLTAMDRYYENGPLPTWIAWHVQQRLGQGFHAATALFILVAELGLVWLAVLPRRFRIGLCVVATGLQVGIILTANYAFLNYLVLFLGLLLLDDRVLARLRLPTRLASPRPVAAWRLWTAGVALAFVFWSTIVTAPGFPVRGTPAPLLAPAEAISTLRIANGYGLFAVMTEDRREIEFQGTVDGTRWRVYRFRFKPQDPREAPGIYAPYQPRFEWNLWFASLGEWEHDSWVVQTAARLLRGEPAVLSLFRDDPFARAPPRKTRAVLWRYWFSDPRQKARRGVWWERELLGSYGPTLERLPSGRIRAVDDDALDGAESAD